MKSLLAFLATFACLVQVGSVEADEAGRFDYYVLALSWTPNWCAIEGDARGADQCEAKHDFGFTLHGLWPQYERGWPDYCRTNKQDPSRRQSAAMADIMGDGGLAWHQWKKHGRCSGLSAQEYYDLSRRAYQSVKRPPALRRLNRTVRINPKTIEAAFIESNPDLAPGGVTVTCKSGRISEVRICLTKGLAPRACGADVRSDCTYSAEFAPIR